MKLQALLTLFALVAVAAVGMPAPASAATQGAVKTPAEQRIAAARKAIELRPDNVHAHNALASALTRRARETADHDLYLEADRVLSTSLELAPDNFAARRIQVWSLLGQHQFERALAGARKLRDSFPDDVQTYGLLADAYAELGRYREAEEAVQWMLDLRPGTVAGLTRGAYLREIHGDVEGAIDWMQEALQRVAPEESEDRAWIATRVASLYRSRGDLVRAEAWLGHAEELFPDYHYTLAESAAVATARGDDQRAALLMRRRFDIAPHPENLYDLALAVERAGHGEEAARLFTRFESMARAETDGADNANPELTAYLIDQVDRIDDALALSEREVERRRTVQTLSLRGWALHKAGRDDEARAVIEEALASGTQDSVLLYRAAEIQQALGAGEKARELRRESLRINPMSEVAAAIRLRLAAAE